MGQRQAIDDWVTVSNSPKDEWVTVSSPDIQLEPAPGHPRDPTKPGYVLGETLDAAKHLAGQFARGIPEAVTGIPAAVAGVVGAMGSPAKQLEIVKGLVRPPLTMLTNAVAAGQPALMQQATPQQNDEAARFGGQTVGGIALGEGIQAVKPLVRPALRAVLPAAETLDKWSAENKARALNPTTLQGKSDAQTISAEMAKKGQASGLLGKTIDSSVIKDLQANGERVGAIEDRLKQEPRPEFQISQDDLLGEIDAAKKKLTLPKTNVTARPEAVAQLNDIRAIIEKLPKFIDFDTAIELRRQLDARAEDAGAFGVNADTLKADISRGVANVVRGELNGLDTELASANHDYSVSRKAADMVERRQLGETGKITSGLPGRGGILDDVLAGWAGHAMGGPVGGAVMEAANLGRQTRGMANVKSAFQRNLADLVRPPVKAFNPAGLIEEGAIPLGRPADTSGAIPLASDQGVYRGLNAQAQIPANAGSTVRPNVNVQARVIQPTSGIVHEADRSSLIKQIPPSAESAITQRALNPAPLTPTRIERSSGQVFTMPETTPTNRGLTIEGATAGQQALPPGRILVTPAPPDASRLTVYNPIKQIARDPKTGRMFKYFTGDNGAVIPPLVRPTGKFTK